MSEKEKFDYLDDERKKLWQAVRELENRLAELTQNTPLSLQSEARGALNKASEYCNRINERRTEVESLILDIASQKKVIETKLDSFNKNFDEFKAKYEIVKAQIPEVENAYKMVIGSNHTWQERIANLDRNYTESESFLAKGKEKFNELQQIASNCDGILKKINNLLSQSSDKKQEISEVYDEIFGYDVPDDEKGENKHEFGLKEELDATYTRLEAQLKEFAKKLDEFKTQKETDYNQFLLQKEKDHDALQQRIKDLLPNALTAGLSHAYAKQCDEEKTERDKSLKAFYWSIGAMTVFAAIPFCLGLTFRYGLGKTWEDVISYLPQFACLMLPLYLPMFWVAFSSSRKANLSKRLIEEYAHKVALSKTFQGLEEQISSLDNSETAMELKVKLLYNLVSVSAENPGKLIPNYNKADNPLIEFMDKSIALSESLEKLKNIPGAAIIAKRILAKQEEKREQIANKALEETEEVE